MAICTPIVTQHLEVGNYNNMKRYKTKKENEKKLEAFLKKTTNDKLLHYNRHDKKPA